MLLAGAHAWLGPIRNPGALTDLGDAFAGVLRHGSPTHLMINLGIILAAGTVAERRIGPIRTLGLVAACAVAGTFAQYALTGPSFIGASGPAYGLACYTLLATATPGSRDWILIAIALVLAIEVSAFAQDLSVATHTISALIGGGFAMFGSLFGSKDPSLKPMKMTHIAQVVAIIEETDEDDALEAEQGFLAGDLEGMFVLARGSRVIGVTGYGLDDQVPDIAWLSWTYLTEAEMGAGLGSTMLNDLLGRLKEDGIRKLFIATSDYAEDGQPIYAAAHRMYADFGAEVELTVPDYHAPGEAKIIYGLANPEYEAGPAPAPHPDTGLAITGAAREPETDGTAGLIWQAQPAGVSGLDDRLEKIRKGGARLATIALPSDISAVNSATFTSHGFINCGELKDYFAPGLNQVWWTCSLASTPSDHG